MNIRSRSRIYLAGIIIGLTLCIQSDAHALAQGTLRFQQTNLVAVQEPLTLEVDIESGQLQVLYSREGQVTLSVSIPASHGAHVGEDSSLHPIIEQNGNHIAIRAPGASREQKPRIALYRLEVPYRTEVISRVGTGKQEITGIMGPVNAVTESGDLRASYVSNDVAATVGTGNLELLVIGGRIQARARHGNISCTRSVQGIVAETGDGDITLTAVGPSDAKVNKGYGRIEVNGARAGFSGLTDKGDIHVKAVVHDDWQLSSSSGNIRVELPSNASFLLDASTTTGQLMLDRDDLERAGYGARRFDQAVNSGGKRIRVHTETGQIAIR